MTYHSRPCNAHGRPPDAILMRVFLGVDAQEHLRRCKTQHCRFARGKTRKPHANSQPKPKRTPLNSVLGTLAGTGIFVETAGREFETDPDCCVVTRHRQ
jgi:hypothetical protein